MILMKCLTFNLITHVFVLTECCKKADHKSSLDFSDQNDSYVNLHPILIGEKKVYILLENY